MRTRLLTIALATLLVLSTGATAVSADKDDEKEKNRDHVTELTLYAIEDAFTYITATGEVDPEEETAPEPGDRFAAVDLLFTDEDREDEAGRNDIECTVTQASGTIEDEDLTANLVCHGVVTLDDQGTLAWQGSTAFSFEEPDEDEPLITVALTGGTGDFARAGGEADIFDTSDEDAEESTATYEVRLQQFKPAKR